MAELRREVPQKWKIWEAVLFCGIWYIERRMTPLNLYLEQASDQQLYDVIEEYGNAIKQLAAANIFPAICCSKLWCDPPRSRVVFMITMKSVI